MRNIVNITRTYDINKPTDESLPSLDIITPNTGVQIQIRDDKKTIWVHVDGQTVLRICRIPKLEIVK